MCPYGYYSQIDNYSREMIICKKNKEICPFTRFCSKQNKIIPNDTYGHTMGDCIMRKNIDLPEGSSRVVKEVSNKDFLYVDIEIDNDLFTYKFKNPYKEIPEYVYVKENIDGTYAIVEKRTRSKKQ